MMRSPPLKIASFCLLVLTTLGAATPAARANPLHPWICTATATNNAGTFFWAMAPSRGEAYKKAEHKCSRARLNCSIFCEYQM